MKYGSVSFISNVEHTISNSFPRVHTSSLGSDPRDILIMTSTDLMSSEFFLFNFPPLAWHDQGENFRKVFFLSLVLTLPFMFNYAVSLFMYHQQHLHTTKQLAPKYPSSGENRVDHFTHQGFKKAFTGPALAPTARSFMKDLVRRCDGLALRFSGLRY